MSTETLMIALFAGGPGLAALILRAWEYWEGRPERDANAAQVLTTTATGLLDKMQARIDHLEEALHAAEQKIVELSARLITTEKYAEELAREKERRAIVEAENRRLRDLLPNRAETIEERQVDALMNPTQDDLDARD